MRIRSARFVGGHSAFYFDDQQAIRQGGEHDGFTYRGTPVTPGFDAVRQAGECVSILLELEDGSIAMGDCAAVQYSGAGGRDPLFLAGMFVPFLERHVRPLLEGRPVDSFLENARFFDTLEIDGRSLHTAVRYGLSQALLDAAALARRCLKAEIICREFGLPVVAEPVPLFAQSGDDRHAAVDKMVLKGVDALPHALINSVPDKLGGSGEKLVEYVQWLAARVRHLRTDASYRPDLHIDVYGTVGLIFGNRPERVAEYLARLGDEAGEFPLYIEGPVDAGARTPQIEALGAVSARLAAMGSDVRIVADEWCNTYRDIADFVDARCCHMVQIKTPDLGGVHNVVDAVRYCNDNGVQAYQGGTCNETDLSARTCVHLALAARPVRMLVKPGMGFDEGMTIVSNEMRRSLAMLNARRNTRQTTEMEQTT